MGSQLATLRPGSRYDGVLGIFHYGEHTTAEAKTRMAQASIPVRPA